MISGLYFSELAREPDLSELVALFVRDLPTRLTEISQAAQTQEWEQLTCLAHQLKGAGGSYGFPHLAAAAAGVERAARDRGSHAEISSTLENLAAACAQTRSGVPDSRERSFR